MTFLGPIRDLSFQGKSLQIKIINMPNLGLQSSLRTSMCLLYKREKAVHCIMIEYPHLFAENLDWNNVHCLFHKKQLMVPSALLNVINRYHAYNLH